MTLALINRDLLLHGSDGVSIRHRSQVSVNPASVQAIRELNNKSFTVVLLSHQPGISRGLMDLDELEAIHEIIATEVEREDGLVSAIFYCPHEEEDHCYCRPPQLGLLDVIEMEFDSDCINGVFFYQTANEKAMIQAKGMRGIDCQSAANDLQPAVYDFIKAES